MHCSGREKETPREKTTHREGNFLEDQLTLAIMAQKENSRFLKIPYKSLAAESKKF